MMILCVLCYAFIVSVSRTLPALLAASLLPLLLLTKKPSLPHIFKLNALNAVMIITLALTWPDVREGLLMGLVIALRANMIYVVFAALVLPMGLGAVYSLPLPEKLKVLVILTVRGIYILRDSLDTALISVKLRAPNVKGIARLKIFAYVLGSVLLRSSARSERMMLAVMTRGGFGGFVQSERVRLCPADWMRLAGCAVYVLTVSAMNYA